MENSGQYRCVGLFVPTTNISIPLTAVNYDVTVNGFASRITINQTYKNQESTDVECVYGFPINDQAGIIGFTVKIDDRVLHSQFKKKDEAFKEYTEAVSRGDGAYLLDQSDRSDDTFVMSVGRLPPGKECTISISYACTLESVTETKMRFVIPMSLSPRYNPKPDVKASGVVPPEKYQPVVSYSATLTGRITAVDVIQSVTSPTHPLKVCLIGPKQVTVEFGAQQQPLDRDFIIEIELKNNPEHHVEVEMTSPGHYAAMYSFVPKSHDDMKSVINTELIFLVDCSGSMEDEGKIDDAKRAMQVFLRSIPEGCYFNFYRFGSTFQTLFPESTLYSAESFAKAKDYAKETKADLGGTEILEPLQKIFSQPPRTGFSRQLFVLTDGDVTNTEAVIDLVRNNNNTRVFSFGLGHSPSRSLVNGIAMAGNGKSEFIKAGEVLEDKIGRHLARALRPAITEANLVWTGVKNLQQAPAVLPPIFFGDRQLVYAFIELEDSKVAPSIAFRTSNFGPNASIPVPLAHDLSPVAVLPQLTARAWIKHLEHAPTVKPVILSGSLQQRGEPSTTDDSGQKAEREKAITEISLKHGVMSRWVSLVAVETRTEADSAKASSDMQLREIPVQKAQSPQVYHQLQSFSSCRMMCGPPAMARAFGGRQGVMACKALRHNAAQDESDDVEMESDDETWATSGPVAVHHAVEKDASNSPQASPLHQLIDLQQWDGSWTFSKELEKVIGVSASNLQVPLQPGQTATDNTTLATLAVVLYIKEKFADQANIWTAIVNKALAYLAKRTDEPALAIVAAEIKRSLFSGE